MQFLQQTTKASTHDSRDIAEALSAVLILLANTRHTLRDNTWLELTSACMVDTIQSHIRSRHVSSAFIEHLFRCGDDVIRCVLTELRNRGFNFAHKDKHGHTMLDRLLASCRNEIGGVIGDTFEWFDLFGLVEPMVACERDPYVICSVVQLMIDSHLLSIPNHVFGVETAIHAWIESAPLTDVCKLTHVVFPDAELGNSQLFITTRSMIRTMARRVNGDVVQRYERITDEDVAGVPEFLSECVFHGMCDTDNAIATAINNTKFMIAWLSPPQLSATMIETIIRSAERLDVDTDY